jgi:intersectin
MDKLEFSIAMRLIRNCLAGIPLPPALPDSLRQVINVPVPQIPMSLSHPAIPPMMTSMHPRPPVPMTAPMPGSVIPSSVPLLPVRPSQATELGTRELNDWTVPQHYKLRYSQQFNQLDRNRVGLLTGNQARGVLGESQLPTNFLAEIWNLSDV